MNIKQKKMKVRITNGAKNHWYENLTGYVFNVLEYSPSLEAYLVETPERGSESSYIYMRDCEEIDDDFNSKLLKAYLDGVKDDNMRQSILAVARHENNIPEIDRLRRSGHVLTANNTPDQQYDFVNPSHYKKFSKETYQMMIDVWGKEAYIAHCEMCAFKYKLRAGEKPDQPVDRDLDKANWYLEMANKLKNEQ